VTNHTAFTGLQSVWPEMPGHVGAKAEEAMRTLDFRKAMEIIRDWEMSVRNTLTVQYLKAAGDRDEYKRRLEALGADTTLEYERHDRRMVEPLTNDPPRTACPVCGRVRHDKTTPKCYYC
jgi:hypothetical protein